MPDPTKLLPRVRAEWQAAAGGEWHVGHDGPSRPIIICNKETMLSISSFAKCRWGPYENEEADAEFIAHCGGDSGYIAQLLALVETLGAGLRANCCGPLNISQHTTACKRGQALKALEEAGG